MPDNVSITPGSGDTVGTDQRTIDGNTVQVQRVAPHGGPGITAGQTEISNSSTAIVAANDNRSTLSIVNRQTVAVWVGASAATTSMFRLDPGDSVSLDTSAAVYGITAAAYTATGDAKVHYIEVTD